MISSLGKICPSAEPLIIPFFKLHVSWFCTLDVTMIFIFAATIIYPGLFFNIYTLSCSRVSYLGIYDVAYSIALYTSVFPIRRRLFDFIFCSISIDVSCEQSMKTVGKMCLWMKHHWVSSTNCLLVLDINLWYNILIAVMHMAWYTKLYSYVPEQKLFILFNNNFDRELLEQWSML
jgi:hypothetical protein